MQDLDFAVMLYLLKNWDGQASLPEYMHKFQETKQELAAALDQESAEQWRQTIQSGGYSM